MTGVRAVIISGCILFGAAAEASAQQVHLPSVISQSQAMDAIPVTLGDAVQRQQAIAANQQRQLEIKRDMGKMAEVLRHGGLGPWLRLRPRALLKPVRAGLATAQ